jgi:hypothetical protein
MFSGQKIKSVFLIPELRPLDSGIAVNSGVKRLVADLLVHPLFTARPGTASNFHFFPHAGPAHAIA